MKYAEKNLDSSFGNRSDTRVEKVGSTGSMLPEHPRFFPGTHKARNYVKDVWILFEAICSVKIA